MTELYYQSIKIFIASPNDVQEERNIAEEVIASVDKICRDTIGLRAECMRWEDLPPLTPKPQDGQFQDVITRELLRNCNVFILILYKRYGSASSGYDVSNTEREVQTVLSMLEYGRPISFLSYFRQTPPDTDPGEQEKKMRDLKKRLEDRGLVYHTYDDQDEFRDKLTHHLYYILMKYRLSTTKQRTLRSFWQLGVAEGQNIPAVALIYPPVDRSYMVEERTKDMWLKRLAPHIVFEDYKCMHKIDKTLRLIGHHDIRTYSSYSFPQDIQDINRVWLCLPRNIPGIQQFRLYDDESRFKITSRKGATEARIIWSPKDSTDVPIVVKSPLSKYLKEQRSMFPDGEWRSELGRILAKDYAILARFTDRSGRKPTILGSLKDYFIAGIRGLGTWGAGWFVDRKYKDFLEYEDKEDRPIQMLLEVTYLNEYIIDVRDVSDEPKSYFDKEFNLRTIRKHIREH